MDGDGGGDGGACDGVRSLGFHTYASKKERHLWKKPSSRNVQEKDLEAEALIIQKEKTDNKRVAPHAIGFCSNGIMVDVVWYRWYWLGYWSPNAKLVVMCFEVVD